MLTRGGAASQHDARRRLYVGDRQPPVFDPVTHTVTMPEQFRAAFDAYLGGGWADLDLPPEMGGVRTSSDAALGDREMVLGCKPRRPLLLARSSVRICALRRWEPKSRRSGRKIWAERRWGATMVLTEPDAGSDVGAGRTKAVQQPDGSWHITGVKRFITSAEHDMTDNIIHLVLARPEGACPGTKGLVAVLRAEVSR